MGKREITPLELVLSELRDFRQEYRADREKTDLRFSKVDVEISGVKSDVVEVKNDMGSAKMLGRAALGLAAVVGAVATWTVDLTAKIIPIVNK